MGNGSFGRHHLDIMKERRYGLYNSPNEQYVAAVLLSWQKIMQWYNEGNRENKFAQVFQNNN